VPRLDVLSAALAFVVSETATPPFGASVAVPRTTAPSMKVTVPVAFGLDAVTLAVKMTPPLTSCAGELAMIVMSVGILLTVCTKTVEVAEL
jgi:hypothetical protein